jgi:hypothetical protein
MGTRQDPYAIPIYPKPGFRNGHAAKFMICKACHIFLFGHSHPSAWDWPSRAKYVNDPARNPDGKSESY